MTTKDRRCDFCDRTFEAPDRRRRFCFLCLPSYSPSYRNGYQQRYVWLRAATDPAAGLTTAAATRWSPPGGWPKAEFPPRPRELNTCRNCGQACVTRAAVFCSATCRLLAHADRKRRARLKRSTAETGVPYTLTDLAQRSDSTCHLCGGVVDMTLSGQDQLGPTVDHLVPLSAGGADCSTNVALAHRACNTKRGTRPLEVAHG